MIRAAEIKDADIIASLAVLMWGNHSLKDLSGDFSKILSHKTARIFLKYEQDIPVGFAQCQLRYDYVEGTESAPVGYLEGLFVLKTYRNKGYAKELLAECEKWAKSNGCREFASDCEIGNNNSYLFHKAVNF